MSGSLIKPSNAGANVASIRVPKKPRGKPFTGKDDPRCAPGFTGKDDPRRNNTGQMNRSQVGFGKTINQMFIDEGLKSYNPADPTAKTRIARVVERVYDEAEIGEQWACQCIFERTAGKVTQPIEAVGDIAVMVIKGAPLEEL